MTHLERLAGGVLMVGLPDPSLDPATGERLRALRPGGVVLFARNLDTPGQTAELLTDLRQLAPEPLLLALDQEGGRVSRLEPWIGPTPDAVALARAGDETTRRFGAATGRALRTLGFNVDFAPVVDLCPPETANGIGNRSFGTDPGGVTRLAGLFLDALQETGVAGCLKHFPGLGDTSVDSHVALPTVGRTLERLQGEDLLPYRVLSSRAACVMVGHGHYPALDPEEERPATCSANAVEGLLRGGLGYNGLVVSDDLEMGAVTARDQDGAAAVEALRAGCDLLLYCTDLDRAEAAARAIAGAAEADSTVAARLSQAAATVRRSAEAWTAAPPQPGSWDLARADFAEFAALA
jgi:beta-N-acetylhexosaminidase